MATLDTKYVVKAQPDGYTSQNVVRTRLFRKTADNFGTTNPGDTLAASVNYAVAQFPKGFIPRSAVANVLKANGSTAAVTVNIAKNATDIASATVTAINGTSSTFAAGTAGTTLIDFAVASSAGTAPWVTGENDYLVITAAAAVDAEFEVVVVGDWPCLQPDRED